MLYIAMYICIYMYVYTVYIVYTSIHPHLISPCSMSTLHVHNACSTAGWMGDRPLPECQRLGFREESSKENTTVGP